MSKNYSMSPMFLLTVQKTDSKTHKTCLTQWKPS